MRGAPAAAKLGSMVADLPELLVPDAAGWRSWLQRHDAGSSGVWLVLAKKGTREPTRLTYDEALEEALCHGWIDGQVGRRDQVTYRQRFTPRRRRSSWSQHNVELAARLISEGRMHELGLAAVEAAKADGRWDTAYAGSREITVPDDLAAALRAHPAAQAAFDNLSRLNRYAILYRIGRASGAGTRARRVEEFVHMLARGETPHPQRSPSASGSARSKRSSPSSMKPSRETAE
jgi:uncharacterized protein YdeI (YjbR/CyaY-like superfamily)